MTNQEHKNPIKEYKENNGYTYFQISQQTDLHPQTVAFLTARTIEQLKEKTSLSIYVKLKNGTGIDLLDHIED